MEQKADSMIISFATEEEAKRAIKNRLYIADISARVIKYTSIALTTQCIKCQGHGHIDQYCKRPANCNLCAESHNTVQHYCNICKAKGKKCIHLEPKCINCKAAHTANDKNCEIYIAIKERTNSTITDQQRFDSANEL